jgi:hypothetical protein
VGEVSFDCEGEVGEVAVADDPAELAFGFEHAGGRPAQSHLARLNAGWRLADSRGSSFGQVAMGTMANAGEAASPKSAHQAESDTWRTMATVCAVIAPRRSPPVRVPVSSTATHRPAPLARGSGHLRRSAVAHAPESASREARARASSRGHSRANHRTLRVGETRSKYLQMVPELREEMATSLTVNGQNTYPFRTRKPRSGVARAEEIPANRTKPTPGLEPRTPSLRGKDE